MKSSIRYATAGLTLLGAGIVVHNFTARPPEPITEPPGIPVRAPLPSPEGRAPAPSFANERQAIAMTLAAHGNAQQIQPSFFTDLIRSMEKSGFGREAARQVAVALAKNPNLDTIAALTVAGSLQGYLATTKEELDAALAELVSYIEQPDKHASWVNERFRILRPDVEALIGDKVRAGNYVAAERLMEEGLLHRFNPSLAAKIFVPRLPIGPL